MDYLEKYKPKPVSLFSQFGVASGLSKEERAFQYWRALVTAKRNQEALFLVIGKLLSDIQEEEMYKVLDYESFNQFISSDEVGFSREKAFLCMRVYRYYILELKLDPEKVGEMNISRLAQMVPVLRKIEDKKKVVEKIEEYQKLSLGDFVRSIKEVRQTSSRPTVYWSEEESSWVVAYYSNTTVLRDLGEFNGKSVKGEVPNPQTRSTN